MVLAEDARPFRKPQMQGAPEKRAAYLGTYASKRFEEQRRKWGFLNGRSKKKPQGYSPCGLD